MKTTFEIDDQILSQVKTLAAKQGRTMRSLVEDGLRYVLTSNSMPTKYEWKDLSVGNPEDPDPLASMDWADIRKEIYGRYG